VTLRDRFERSSRLRAATAISHFTSRRVRQKKFSRLRAALAVAAFAIALPVVAAATPSLFPALSPGLSLLERHYLFDSELAPARLFDEAGKNFSRDVPDLTIRKLSDRAWLYMTPDCELRVEVPADATVRTLETPLATVGRFLEACSTHLPPKMPSMDSYLLGGVLSGLDPYSVVFDAKNQAEHNIQYQGKLAGIGARIGSKKNQLTLIEVYPDSPAARADLRNDDTVLRIDNLSTKNILATDAVERIRGEEGTTVTLLIQRLGETEPRSVIVTRGIVMIPSVKSRILNADILYTEISQFSQTTPDDFRQHLKKAVEDKHLRGVIIDLRKNSGGSMMGSSAIGDLFLKDGLLITTAGRDGQPARGLTPEVRASGAALTPDLPVVFLTSPITASGSELLAASLRNNDRALILGEHTFGKGCIQKTFPLHESSTMKMTVGHFLPNGQPIPGGGLVPDIEVLTWRVGKGRLAVPVPIDLSDTPFWLRSPEWSKIEAAPSLYRIAFAEEFGEDDPSLIEDPEEEMEARLAEEKFDADKPDRMVEIAAAILRNHGSTSAQQMLADARDFLARTVETSEADLTEFMYDHGLDWTDGPRPETAPNLTLQVIPVTPLRAGEESEVDVRLTNNSQAPFYRLRGLLDSTSMTFDRKAVAFGRIEPGATRGWRMKVKPPGPSRTGRVKIEASLFDDEGSLGKLAPVRLTIIESPRPHLALQARITAAPDDPSKLDIALDVENRGAGTADKVIVRIKHPIEEQFEIIEGAGDADSIAPGAKASFVLKARLQGSFEKMPEALVYVTEQKHGLYLERKTPLTVTPAGAATVDANASGASPPPEPEEAARSGWNEPPRIVIEGFSELNGEEVEVRISATDDHGLSQVRVRVDDDTVAYVEPSGPGQKSAELRVPWKPSDDVRKLRVEAIDTDGMKELYAGSL
jgi:C-terminal peptidase prc